MIYDYGGSAGGGVARTDDYILFPPVLEVLKPSGFGHSADINTTTGDYVYGGGGLFLGNYKDSIEPYVILEKK